MIAELGRDRIVILSTHIVSDVEEIADWIFLMKQGQFLAQGTLETLREHYLEVTHSECMEAFNLEKLYLFYFSEGSECVKPSRPDAWRRVL